MRHAGDMQSAAVRPDRTLIGILAVIVALVLIAVVVVLTKGGPTKFDPASPEGVVQAYTNAVLGGDSSTALGLLSSAIRENCERNDPTPARGFSMTIDSTNIDGNRAVMRISTEQGTGGLYGGPGYTTDDKFILVKEGGAWRIETAPWELMMCLNMEALDW